MQENDTANPYAVSGDNAHFGLGQISADISNKFSNGDYNDPNQNILAAGSYLAYLLNKFDGDLRLAVAGYNAGEAGARGSLGGNTIITVNGTQYSSATGERNNGGFVNFLDGTFYNYAGENGYDNDNGVGGR